MVSCNVHSYCTEQYRRYAGRLLQSVKSRTPTWDYRTRAANQFTPDWANGSIRANPISFHPSVFPSFDPPLVPPAQLATLLANPSEDLECSGRFRLTVDLPNAWMEVRRLEGRGERSKVSPGG
ncbi:hypothetical protein PO909_004103 [Leuciscus waleckii]